MTDNDRSPPAAASETQMTPRERRQARRAAEVAARAEAMTRRDLLKAAPLAGGATLLAGQAAASPASPEALPPDDRQPRLADNAHTRTYYALARS